jgi:outer membrane immunogenic protein
MTDGFHAAPPIWTGFYFGAAAGYGIGVTDLKDNGVELFDTGLRGAQGVVVAGYDWQLSPALMLGVFGDYAFGEIEGSFNDADDIFAVDKQWAIGARLGLLATPSTLFYASAGYTRADFEVSSDDLSLNNETLDGYFVGLGVEQAISRNLAFKLDYRFSDYRDFTSGNSTLDNEVHSVRLGLNWRFHAGGGTHVK